MGKTIAIICEYNPFHNGHQYQIDKIRKEIPDATIIAIMSGNVTQRGEFAIFDKYSRAKGAVLCGVNAVFEMPYPYSCANAEIFALAGVKIASELGAECLCFGSESNDIEYLTDVANAIDSHEFEIEMEKQLQDKSKSYSVSRELALKKIGREVPKSANDMLAVEYLRAINKINPSISPYPIKREGAAYNDLKISDIMSARAIRNEFYSNDRLCSVPDNAKTIFNEEIIKGLYLNSSVAEDFLFRNVIRSSPNEIEKLFDVPCGCGFFMFETAKNSTDATEFFRQLTSKSYTYSRLKRIVMYLAMGTKNIDKVVNFTVLLATDEKGRALIKKVKKASNMIVITKHSDSKKLNEKELCLYNDSKKVDELYFSLLSSPIKATEAYKKTSIML